MLHQLLHNPEYQVLAGLLASIAVVGIIRYFTEGKY